MRARRTSTLCMPAVGGAAHTRVLTPLLSTLALLGCFAGCSSDGKTPDCPELPLYDVRDPSAREQHRAELEAAAAKGCVTLAKRPDDEQTAGAGGGSSEGDGGTDAAEAGNTSAEP
ncbi:MAG TPA: hypothetical protein VER33_11025 [Polyangiaceae bacterium]|nr:hypothetical protein [Polyangiaceae bacterium]